MDLYFLLPTLGVITRVADCAAGAVSITVTVSLACNPLPVSVPVMVAVAEPEVPEATAVTRPEEISTVAIVESLVE
jgi:hypothetical protein